MAEAVIRVAGLGKSYETAAGLFPALKGVEADADQSVPVGIFFDGEYLPVGVLHIAIATSAPGQCLWSLAVQGLQIQLLVGLVDEHHTAIAQAERPTAILVYPAAHTESVGCQATCLAIAPVPDATGGVSRAVFIPEQPGRTDPQLCEIDSGGYGECGAEGFSLLR